MRTRGGAVRATGWSGTCDKFTVKGRMKIEELVENDKGND